MCALSVQSLRSAVFIQCHFKVSKIPRDDQIYGLFIILSHVAVKLFAHFPEISSGIYQYVVFACAKYQGHPRDLFC